MVSALLLVGILVAVFVGYNVGGATTGPAFGPAVGADAISKTAAGVLMTVFFFIGAWTIGRRVVDTLGRELVQDPGVFTLEASIGVLFFIGAALFVGNFFGVPASTSMTAVGSIAGLGLAAGELNVAVMGEIAIWWVVSPFIGFWVSLIIGRYFYSSLNRRLAMVRSEGPLYRIDRSRRVPVPVPTETTNRRELGGIAMVIVIGCLMAFSSGTSNIANAVAPLVGSGELAMNPAIVIGCAAVGIGTVTIARRTLETMGNDLTELPLTAAIVTATVSASLVIFLSAIGIPASFVIIATMCIIGLGWGRATRPITVADAVRGEESVPISVDALTADEEGETLPPIGDEDPERIPRASDLFDPATTARVVLMQNIVPVIATAGAYATFRFVPIFGL
ncbi:phosphate transporter [Natrinema pellirubrum DSM 15624]|uniref:Phosphate transporter n=1 Tax=Natrinema pellirubrum (strain DSM 15624 / CIP 106293 / JCM 10476 / NCIMB 786 / 157) TaxID=797303 RepID=L0JI44_NATP1|nr:inorganic phosphate transporter [Natrinema pellirubrum]AGB30006.1 phosphate/sulfate permease [Natrinema pellirubrum DSM 15624]ELY70316.1 phosphate transporter [Natrinema pellirubrum DSM 15624]